MKPLAILLFLLLSTTACNQQNNTEESIQISDNAPIPEANETIHGNTSHRQNVLVNSAWLKDNLSQVDLHVLEFGRTYDEFLSGHIPTAKYLDWRKDISDQSIPEKYNILPQREFEALMSRLGILPESTIVLYDTMSSRAATRMFWMLKYYSHGEVKVLDGGLSSWQTAGYDLSQTEAEVLASDYQVKDINIEYLVDRRYVENNLSNSAVKLVDGRPFSQYTGESPGKVFNTGTEHLRVGHIYGAKTVPWADNLQEDGTFKSASELIEIYQAHEIDNNGIVVTYCNEGLHAAMPWFVLHELLGYDDVRLYDSSMAEWANTYETAIKEGEHCM